MPTRPFTALYQRYRERVAVPGPASIMPANLWRGIWRGRQMVSIYQYGPLQPPQDSAPFRNMKAPLTPRDGVTTGRNARQSRMLHNRTANGQVIHPRGIGNPSATQYAQLRPPRWQEGFYGVTTDGMLDEPATPAVAAAQVRARAAAQVSARLRAPGTRETTRPAPLKQPGLDILG